jgi:hypothetical protein
VFCTIVALASGFIIVRRRIVMALVIYTLFCWVFLQFFYWASEWLFANGGKWVPVMEELVKALVITLAAGTPNAVYGSLSDRIRYSALYGTIEYTTWISEINSQIVAPNIGSAPPEIDPALLLVLGNLLFLPFWIVAHGLFGACYIAPSRLRYLSVCGPLLIHYGFNFLLNARL